MLIHAIILGIVEGLTEFLPVSSTGHLILVGQLLGFNDDKGKVFEIAIQFAAILAVVWEYRARLAHTLASITSEPVSTRLAINLMVAFLPAAVLGFLFLKQIKAHLFNPIVVASAFIIGGFLILWAERRQHVVHAETVDDMTWRDALKVGFAQALSMIPGHFTFRRNHYRRTVFRFVAPCRNRVFFFPRYPHHVCRNLIRRLQASRLVQCRRYCLVRRWRHGVVYQRLLCGTRIDTFYQPTRFHRVRVVSHRFRHYCADLGADGLGRLG